jgi:hypothetical protein
MHFDASHSLVIFLHFTRWVLSRINGWLGFVFLLFCASLYEGEHRFLALLVVGMDTKDWGYRMETKHDESRLFEWLVEHVRAANRGKNEFPFHVAFFDDQKMPLGSFRIHDFS